MITWPFPERFSLTQQKADLNSCPLFIAESAFTFQFKNCAFHRIPKTPMSRKDTDKVLFSNPIITIDKSNSDGLETNIFRITRYSANLEQGCLCFRIGLQCHLDNLEGEKSGQYRVIAGIALLRYHPWGPNIDLVFKDFQHSYTRETFLNKTINNICAINQSMNYCVMYIFAVFYIFINRIVFSIAIQYLYLMCPTLIILIQ